VYFLLYLDTPENGEGNGEEKRVNEALDWLQDRDVLDQCVVPKETEDECADEDGEQQNQNFSESIRSILGLDKILNHFIIYIYFFLGKL
jgi:hypothetical protein